MKRRIAATLMCICVAASMCACGSGSGTAQPSQPAEEAQEGASGAGKATAEEAAADDTAAEADTLAQEDADLSDVRPSVSLMCFNKYEDKDMTTIASCSYDAPALIEEAAIAYPQLNKTLTTDSDAIAAQYEKSFDEIEEAAESAYDNMEGDAEDFPAGKIEGSMEVVRCDTSVLSLLDTTYIYYPGSAHGMTGFDGYNYDTASGNPIELSDVFADMKAMETAIADNLVSTATGEKVPVEDSMLEFAFEDAYENLNWVIDRESVRFLFGPSDVAPYALGTVEARLYFDEHPELFTGKYGTASGSYVQKLNPYELYAVDLDGDGSKETLSVNGIEEETDSYYHTGLEVHVGEEAYTQEVEFYDFSAYLFHTEDGSNYVYAITGSDNDYQTLTVFAIKDKVISTVGQMEGTGAGASFVTMVDDDGEFDAEKSFSEWFPFTDPAHFALATRMQLMSSCSAMRYYEVGSDGMPVPQTEQYQIRNGIELTSLVELKAEEVDEMTGALTGKEVDLPVGSKCTFYGTNGSDTVDLRMEDGTIVRFHVDGNFPQTVNGVNLEEAFDGVVFAG